VPLYRTHQHVSSSTPPTVLPIAFHAPSCGSQAPSCTSDALMLGALLPFASPDTGVVVFWAFLLFICLFFSFFLFLFFMLLEF